MLISKLEFPTFKFCLKTSTKYETFFGIVDVQQCVHLLL
jgi:hypothetical protein